MSDRPSSARMTILSLQQRWAWGSLLTLLMAFGETGFAHVVGELGEMDRLEQRADEAIANGDAEGAAQSIGKAALMAALIGRKEENPRSRMFYQAAETLFRGQEQAYRAIALFERAGGQTPASQGVCQYLVHAAEKVIESRNNLIALKEFNSESLKQRQQRHITRTEDWKDLLEGLQQDFSC
jgi:hypothetical protein